MDRAARALSAPEQHSLPDWFRAQGEQCAKMGSPIYAELLDRAAADLERGGPFADLVAGYRGHPALDALPFRIFGRVHALVLEGRAPGLARFYPSAGGAFEPEGAWRALLQVAGDERDSLREAAERGRVQTNEVLRSTALLPGFLRVASRTRLPLRLREIGASAGLNLLFDRYRFALGPHAWGDPGSALRLETAWEGAAPDLDARLRVADRRGCDVAPIDVRLPGERVRLLSYVWPDQCERLERMRAAMEIVSAEAPVLDTEPAGEWVAREVAPREGFATVLFHSVMWWYVPEEERARITRAMEAAGAAARPDAPVAWLRMEGANLDEAEIRLRLWPAGEDTLLGAAHYHGAWVRFRG